MVLERKLGFFGRNVVMIVGIPGIIGLHWGWWKVQQNDVLVSPEERKDMPIIVMFKRMKSYVERKFSRDGPPNSIEDEK